MTETANIPKIRVMLVDDHAVVLKGLALILNSEPGIVVAAKAHSGAEAIALYREHKPDIALVDLKLGDISGADVIRAIRSEHPGAKAIILTTFDRDEDVYRSIRAGALGYLVKDAPCEEIVSAIVRVHEGGCHYPPLVSEKLAQRLAKPELSDREVDVLRLMAAGKSNTEISKALSIAIGTIKCHVNSIFTKLDAADRTEAVVTALRRGLTELSSEPARPK